MQEQTTEGFVRRIAGIGEGREAAGTEETRQQGTVVEQGEACARASGMVLYNHVKTIPVSAGLAMDTRSDLSLLEEHNLNPLH